MTDKTTAALHLAEEALEDIVRVFKFETGTPVEALAVIRAARAQGQAEQEPVAELFLGGIVDGEYGECEVDPWQRNIESLQKRLVNDYKPVRLNLYAAPVQQVDLTDELQQKCSDWGTYWRAPDAHGVNLSIEQATELLRDALGVEVEITPPVRTKDLTDDEIYECYTSDAHENTPRSFARAVIAADREKNK